MTTMATFISLASLMADRKESTAGKRALMRSSVMRPLLALAGKINVPPSPSPSFASDSVIVSGCTSSTCSNYL